MSKKRLFLYLSIIIGIILLIGIYYLVDPASSKFFPRCPLLVVSGYTCPGCGSQRVVHSLLNGDIIGAFRHNALLTLAIPLLLLMLVAEIQRKRWPKLYGALNSNKFVLALILVVILWWIGRNIFNI
ncbi:MAG: DUF2752 domain-containing protein [Porphyromonas sp.]|nr:DUF2752 domain-containing protein [Porphyromonas sp.]